MAGALTTEEVASLYRRHAGMVYQISRMLLKNGPDAEDAVQTVFRRAMMKLIVFSTLILYPPRCKSFPHSIKTVPFGIRQ